MKGQAPKYNLLESGTFLIENYNRTKPFSSFLPGISGLKGIPLWAFYVNRGQCVASFGTRNKDHAILEFQPANKAYQLTSSNGFRTFIKCQNKNFTYEPFQIPGRDENEIAQQMEIRAGDLKIKETNAKVGLETTVHYFTFPNEPFAGLARILTLKNNSNEKLSLSLLDGLPQIIPYGMNNWLLKNMSRTAEAWIQATPLQKGEAAFYNLKVEVIDSPEMVPIEQGHFYTSLLQQGDQTKATKVIYDPTLIFGSYSDFSTPELFYEEFQVPEEQILANKTPCALGLAQFELAPNETVSLYTTIGQVKNKEQLNKILPTLHNPKTYEAKAVENKQIIEEIEDRIWTKSGSTPFDHYCKQSFLDNVLRGGLPYSVPTKKSPFLFHLYWRKHGDLERDYNNFQVLPTYYAQGNANYRDVNQNRRMDSWFNVDVGDANILTFLNLIQLDGYNPLVLRSVKFHFVRSAEADKELETCFEKKDCAAVCDHLKKPIAPGEFLMWLEHHDISLRVPSETLLKTVLSHSERIQEIDPSEGYWVDHWHYNLDLLESYLGLFPEKLNELFVGKKIFSFYNSPVRVRARDEKYILQNGHVRQFESVFHDKEKEEELTHPSKDPFKVRTQFGKGEVYHTSLLAKLFTLLFNKMATLDPFGVGIEMEAGRPNWYDALNGLPGLLGSSVSETFELKRFILFLQNSIQKAKLAQNEKTDFPVEVFDLFKSIDQALSANEFDYWDQTSSAKEKYREKIRLGISGKEKSASIEELSSFLDKCEKKVTQGLKKAWSEKEKAPYSYFINEVTESALIKGKTNGKSSPCVRAKKFDQKPLPLFLEGVVHALRLEQDPNKARSLYEAVKKSDLYDKKLGMYKVNASIQEEPVELGRNRIFSPGWLENGSVFMHMEFKYLLELLRSGLVEEFYTDLKKALPAFMDPAVYGRSILENSSFIASSNNPDPQVHGTGFVARLSGVNAEWIHIWHLMTVGKEPFRLTDKGELEFAPQPLLPSWLFTEKENTFSFRFLGEIELTYHNPSGKDTFGSNPVCVKKWTLVDKQGKKVEVEGTMLQGELANKIRAREIKSIHVELG